MIKAFQYPTPKEFDGAAVVIENVLRQMWDGDVPFVVEEMLRDDPDNEAGECQCQMCKEVRGGHEAGGFTWVSHRGRVHKPSKMVTPYLFYALRMIYNHSVPPVFRVACAGERIKRYRDVPHWTMEYRAEAMTELSAELATRDDLDAPLQEQVDDMAGNALLLKKLGL